ncbi:LytTR family DNA-binding domain-containing protein [Phenylobacterium sp.]|uniref:LytR/AlgR family response regulator transcription factor n=1 Tax=Phenylobacterium sp. TaxID=1871053 RepID=UPI00301C9447
MRAAGGLPDAPGPTRPLRVALVDDEPPALRRLRLAVETVGGAVVVGEAAHAEAARALIARGDVDVVLLDIRMPGVSGLELARAVESPRAPAFIFVTAYSRFAAEAFELAAVDYLLKPVEFQRLEAALERARHRLGSRTAGRRIAELEAALRAAEARPPPSAAASPVRPPRTWVKELWAPDRGDRVRIPVEAIDWIEAERDYVRIHTRGRSFLIRKPIRTLQGELDPQAFVRVHRGALVRRDGIVRLARRTGGPTAVVLRSGAEIPVARRETARVRRLIGLRDLG